jgi:hypothetical protein
LFNSPQRGEVAAAPEEGKRLTIAATIAANEQELSQRPPFSSPLSFAESRMPLPILSIGAPILSIGVNSSLFFRILTPMLADRNADKEGRSAAPQRHLAYFRFADFSSDMSGGCPRSGIRKNSV